MFASSSVRLLVVALLTLSLAGSDAFADRGGGGGRRSGGGDGGGRSWSGGGGRSFSGGRGDSGGGGRSWSGGPSRSFSGGGGERSVRSFSGGPSRSFGEATRGGSSNRSFSSRPSFGGSSEGAARMRTFGGQSASRSPDAVRPSRDPGSFGSQLRQSNQGAWSSRNLNRGGSPPTFSSGSRDASRISGSERPRSVSPGDPSSIGRRFSGDDLNARSRDFNRQRDNLPGSGATARTQRESWNNDNGARSAEGQSRRQYAASRPTNEQVRDFLELRRGDSSRQSRSDRSDRFTGDASRRDAGSNLSGNLSRRPADLGNRVRETQNEGDRAWASRFGNANRGDRSGRGDANRLPGGDRGRGLGAPNREVGGDNERNFRDRGNSRDFGDREFADRSYDSWRRNAWRGDRGEGRDHRDQSGRWKDGDRFVAARNIRDHWRGHRDRDNVPFRSGWWKGHNHHRHGHHRWHWHYWDDFAYRHHRPFYWWSWCSAPRLTTWVSFGWTTPYYWDYGPGEYIYCYNDVIYVNGAWYQPAPIFYENTLVLAQRVPDWTPEEAAQVEWLPLGVFVVARDGLADTNVLLQLAVTKDGVIGGTVFNQLTGATFAVEGSVEKETQRAVWSYVDDTNARIVMETSIFNLTQPEATGLIHYGPDNIQIIELVRLEEPAADAVAPALP